MKSLAKPLFASAVCLLTAATSFAQVIPAISLGDPIPAYQADPNVVKVSGSSCNGCAAKLNFQACSEPAKACGCKETIVSVACPGDCKSTPCCAIAAKPAPCKACDVPKIVHRIPASCSTCAPAPAPVPCKTCSTPAPALCAACAAKPVCHVAKPAPCNPCPAPAPCPIATKACDIPCAKPAPAAPCSTCDACKAQACKVEHSRPIIEALKKLLSSPGHHAAPAACESCATCAPAQATPPKTTTPVQTLPVQNPTTIPHQTSYRAPAPTAMPVNAAIAPYAPQATFTTALPPAEVNLPQR